MSASVGVLSSKTYFRSTENLLISNLACHILSYRVVLWFLCYVWHRLAQGDQQQVGSSTLGHRYVSSFPGETGMIYDAHWCSCCRYLRLWDCQDTCLSAFSFCSQDNLQGSGLLGTNTRRMTQMNSEWHTNTHKHRGELCRELSGALSDAFRSVMGCPAVTISAKLDSCDSWQQELMAEGRNWTLWNTFTFPWMVCTCL